MNKIDLHIHSNVSDGTCSPQQIIDLACNNKLHKIAICDHDTFEAYRRVDLNNKNIEIVKGIEVSCFDPLLKKEIHILGYHLKEELHTQKLCYPTLKQRREIAFKQVFALQDHGIAISMHDVLTKAQASTSVYKQHILDVLRDMGVIDELYGDFYRQVFKNGGYCQFPLALPTPADVIKAIHQDHGMAFLAHPFASKINDQLDHYKKLGIDGIEVWHSAASEKEAGQLYAYCLVNELLMSGGSDYHGDYGNEPDIGMVHPLMKEDLVL